MKTYRVTYRNLSLNRSSSERLEEDIKNMFWLEGKEPENWRNFDGDLDVKSEQSRGGDCVTLNMNTDSWCRFIVKELNKKRDVLMVEEYRQNEYGDYTFNQI